MSDTKTRGLPKRVVDILKAPLPEEAYTLNLYKKLADNEPMIVISPIYVVERLNEAFGVGGWALKNEVLRTPVEPNDWALIHSTLHVRDYEMLPIDQFGGNNNRDPGDALKGAATDAMTKIASYLGIGSEVFKREITARDVANANAKRKTIKKKDAAKKGSSNEAANGKALDGYTKKKIIQALTKVKPKIGDKNFDSAKKETLGSDPLTKVSKDNLILFVATLQERYPAVF